MYRQKWFGSCFKLCVLTFFHDWSDDVMSYAIYHQNYYKILKINLRSFSSFTCTSVSLVYVTVSIILKTWKGQVIKPPHFIDLGSLHQHIEYCVWIYSNAIFILDTHRYIDGLIIINIKHVIISWQWYKVDIPTMWTCYHLEKVFSNDDFEMGIWIQGLDWVYLTCTTWMYH